MKRKRKPTTLATARKKKMFKFIVKYKSKHNGVSPNIREIGNACGISSTSLVNCYLSAMEKDSLIRNPKKVARGIEVVGAIWIYAP